MALERARVTVYRRPDPIPLRRAPVTTSAALVTAVRSETDDLNRLVAREIFLAIAGGRFPVGSILPNEHQLAADLGVSRTALREAIKGLASKGMVETRRKRGTQVLERSRWNMLDAEVIAWSRRSGSARVSEELWASLVVTLPALAAAAATGRHSHVAIAAATRYLAAPSRDSFGALLCDVATAGENRFLASLTASAVHSLLDDDAAFLDRRRDGFRPAEVERLAEALRRRDGVDAQAVMAQALGTQLEAVA